MNLTNKCSENAQSTCKSYPNCYGCNAHRNPTNYERIKNMSVEEMAEILERSADCDNYCAFVGEDGLCTGNPGDYYGCLAGVKKWLESEVEEE